jgi:hypothetical protein
VDLVTWFDADTPLDLILLHRPQVLVKGRRPWEDRGRARRPVLGRAGLFHPVPVRSLRPRRPSPASGVPTPRKL